jgi:5-methylcytosine-specific restriction endonuclease McrA
MGVGASTPKPSGIFMTEYEAKLNTPQWKKKAFKIIKRDGFRCTVCGGKNRLQVHHTFYYEDYRDPWLYPDDSLLTVCKKCHKAYHEFNESEIRPVPERPKIKVKKHKEKRDRRKMTCKFKRKKCRVLCLAEIQDIRGLRIRGRIRD